MRYSKKSIQETKEHLSAILPVGSKVYVTAQHVSKSGMSRDIKCLADNDGIRNINYYVSVLTGYPFKAENQGVRITGCGMDMGFALVCELAYRLHGSESALKHEWI